MNKYRKAEAVKTYSYPISMVWNVVINNEDVAWRSDLDRIEIVDDTHFIEYTKKQQETNFTITEKRAMEYYAFTMENSMFDGYWTGSFQGDETSTTITFTEHIHVKNSIIRLLSYVFMDIRKIQQQYLDDLQKKLDTMSKV